MSGSRAVHLQISIITGLYHLINPPLCFIWLWNYRSSSEAGINYLWGEQKVSIPPRMRREGPRGGITQLLPVVRVRIKDLGSRMGFSADVECGNITRDATGEPQLGILLMWHVPCLCEDRRSLSPFDLTVLTRTCFSWLFSWHCIRGCGNHLLENESIRRDAISA